jgi:heterotetrameric sarcosine oxidase gamma subunit
MPEVISTLVAQSGLPSGGRVFSDFLKLAVLPNRNILQLRLGARSVKTIASLRIAGRTVPIAMNSWSGDDPVFCRIAPDLWLLQSALHEAGDLEEAVRAGCGKRSFAVTNVSDACATLVLEGSLAASLLARGCGLDFSLNAFGTAACSRTRLGQLPVVIRRVNSERFECLVDRSAAQYLYDWIEDAVAGLE